MSENPILRVLASAPIDRKASIVASQKGCAEGDRDHLRIDELKSQLAVLQRRQSDLRDLLGVENKSQQKNLKVKVAKGLRHGRVPVVQEYIRNGNAIQIISKTLADINREDKEWRKRLGAIENAWRAEHPGSIWDGRQLVAPNGETFSRFAQVAEA
jgi:hypothetical protein